MQIISFCSCGSVGYGKDENAEAEWWDQSKGYQGYGALCSECDGRLPQGQTWEKYPFFYPYDS